MTTPPVPRASAASVVAGVLTAYGAFAILVALATAVAKWAHVDATMSLHGWQQFGIYAGVGGAVVLFLCFLYGGYVAGRMAVRAGFLNGLLTAIGGIILAVCVGAAGASLDGRGVITRQLRSVGAPTSFHDWSRDAGITGIAVLAAIVLGSLLGGRLGQRWHASLATPATTTEPATAATAATTTEPTVTGPATVSGTRAGEEAARREPVEAG